jgi:hypothetical protein
MTYLVDTLECLRWKTAAAADQITRRNFEWTMAEKLQKPTTAVALDCKQSKHKYNYNHSCEHAHRR